MQRKKIKKIKSAKSGVWGISVFHVKQSILKKGEFPMKESINLNTRQLTLLLSNLLITKMMFAFPRFLFKTSGNAAWIQAIYMSLIAYILLIVSLKLYQYTGNKSIIQLAESIGKTPLKILVSLCVALIIIANAGTEMRTFAESVKIILLPKTKIEYIMILFTFIVCLGAYKGFSSLVTINALIFPFCLFFLGVLVTFLLPAYDINNLFPIFGTGIKNIFVTGLKDMSCFSDLIALNLLLPYCGDIETVKKSGKNALLIGGITLTLICFSYALTYPYPYSREFLLIPYQLSRILRAGEYFQRFEALFEFVWSLTQLLYSSIYVFILCNVFRDTFKLKSREPLIPCTALLISLLSFEPSSIVALLDKAYTFKERLIPLAYILPILIPLLFVLKRRKTYEK